MIPVTVKILERIHTVKVSHLGLVMAADCSHAENIVAIAKEGASLTSVNRGSGVHRRSLASLFLGQLIAPHFHSVAFPSVYFDSTNDVTDDDR